MTAGLWAFLISLLTGFFRRDTVEVPLRDPQLLLLQAQQEMRENQAKNRERAVQAITQKNNLQAELDKTRRTTQKLEEKAEAALAAGNKDEARQLGLEADSYRSTLALIEGALERATVTTEAIKTAIRGEEERIRAKTAQAMAAKTDWRAIQISASLKRSEAANSSPRQSAQRRLDAVLEQMERTRVALWNEAQAALEAGEFMAAIRLLTEHQHLDAAIILGKTPM